MSLRPTSISLGHRAGRASKVRWAALHTRAVTIEPGSCGASPDHAPGMAKRLPASSSHSLKPPEKTAPMSSSDMPLGAPMCGSFAGQRPDAVCGMVLVDSSHPQQLVRFAEIGVEKEIPRKRLRPLILLLSHLGMPGRFKSPQYSMPRSVYDAQQAFLPASSSWISNIMKNQYTT